jgi:cysteine-rich repeat protein
MTTTTPTPRRSDDEPPPALVGRAVRASQQQDWCGALAAFLALDTRWPSPWAVYNAAEVAYAAGDRARALDLYRAAQARYPDHERKAAIRRRVDEVFASMVRDGPGTSCPLPPACGDWFLQPGEACDDGNGVDGDGCDHDCSLTSCGNGVVTAGESCDDENNVDGDGCDRGCIITACGNGVVTAGESCDDGNSVDGDGCDRGCVDSRCGNGVRADNEACDDGNDVDGDGCDHGCVVTACGNGIVTAGERCDDGNVVDGDGCERGCAITRRPAPATGIIVASGGGVAVVGGLALVVSGVLAWQRLDAAVRAVDTERKEYPRDPGNALKDIDDDVDELEAARVGWDGAAVGLWSGVGLALGGGGALATGVWLALTQTEEVTP